MLLRHSFEEYNIRIRICQGLKALCHSHSRGGGGVEWSGDPCGRPGEIDIQKPRHFPCLVDLGITFPLKYVTGYLPVEGSKCSGG